MVFLPINERTNQLFRNNLSKYRLKAEKLNFLISETANLYPLKITSVAQKNC
jgi:hypothetical protein